VADDHPRPLRQGERAPIPRAVDRPAPAPIDIKIDDTRRRRSSQKRPGRRRSLRQWLASKTGRRVLIALACVAVLLAGLLWQGFLNSPAPDVNPPAAAAPLPTDTLPTPSVSPKASKSTTTGTGTTDQGVLATLRGRFPDNPLNHLSGAGVHDVVIQVDSAAPVPVLGWLVPTGLSNTYGTRDNGSGHFSLSQQALGKGYLAAIFIQAGKLGLPVTCRVIVDGKVTNQETTSGPYGRTVCLG
jgi:hypothetical protein